MGKTAYYRISFSYTTKNRSTRSKLLTRERMVPYNIYSNDNMPGARRDMIPKPAP